MATEYNLHHKLDQEHPHYHNLIIAVFFQLCSIMEDSNPTARKKRRIESAQTSTVANDEDPVHSRMPYLDDRVMRRILSYMPWKVLDEVECISRRCHDVRKRHKALDRTREAIVKFLPPSSPKVKIVKIEEKNTKWKTWEPRYYRRIQFKFSNQYRRLVLVDLHNVSEVDYWKYFCGFQTKAHSITHITLKGHRSRCCKLKVLQQLLYKLTRVKEAHFIDVHFENDSMLHGDLLGEHYGVAEQWPMISHLDCRHSSVYCFLDMTLSKFNFLKELNLDHATIRSPTSTWLEGARSTLEKVSCVNLKVKGVRDRKPKIFVPDVSRPFVAFVETAPKLRWFRSDLQEMTVVLLRGQRPDVTFVSPSRNVDANSDPFSIE